MTQRLIAGAAAVDITPKDSQFLFGYPHVERYSTGVHDPLLSSALFLSDGRTPILFVGNDIIYVSRASAERVRARIEAATGIPAGNIMLTATHTHSGPMTADMIGNESDAIVPKTDPRYVELMETGIFEAAVKAFQKARPAEIGFAVADASCVGTNRHDPAGPANPTAPVLVARATDDGVTIAAMVVCSMHPTVLHEDSTLVSGDFPAMARQYLQQNVLQCECPVVFHTGPCGDQSPRHVTKENTFAEAERLGNLLGRSIGNAIGTMTFSSDISIGCSRKLVELPARAFPSVAQADRDLAQTAARLDDLRRQKADRRDVRTAECDWFGAEETLTLARAAEAGRLDAVRRSVMPAEVIVARIGSWSFVGWPGESFVEFSLAVKAALPNCHVISVANGELQGYLSTEEAVQKGWYEGRNSLFQSPQSGNLLVAATLELLKNG